MAYTGISIKDRVGRRQLHFMALDSLGGLGSHTLYRRAAGNASVSSLFIFFQAPDIQFGWEVAAARRSCNDSVLAWSILVFTSAAAYTYHVLEDHAAGTALGGGHNGTRFK